MTRQQAATHMARVFAFLGCGQPQRARADAEALIAWLTSITR